MKWPTKTERESLEIQGFIKEYKRLPHGRSFVVEEEGENPDRSADAKTRVADFDVVETARGLDNTADDVPQR